MDKLPEELPLHNEIAERELAPPVPLTLELQASTVDERALLEASDGFGAQRKIYEIRDELGLPPDTEEPLFLRQFEQHLPEHLQVKEGEESVTRRHLRRLFLEQLVRARDLREIPAFVPGDPLGEWLVETMRGMGYRVAVQENEHLGLTIVTAVEKRDVPQESAPLPEQKEAITPESVAESLLESAATLEHELSEVTITDEGVLVFPELLRGHETGQLARIEEIRKQSGVRDAQLIMGCIVVTYNANENIPTGFPDLRQKNRSGEYEPREQIVYIDISNAYSFLKERYTPSSLTMGFPQLIRHELEHYLVNYSDHKIAHRLENTPIDRYSEDEAMQHDEGFLQLTYLDELHSHFLQYIEGGWMSAFQNSESKIYSVAREGTHDQVAGNEEATKAHAKELFPHLQLLILLNEFGATTQNEEQKKAITAAVYASGTALGLSRNVGQALALVKTQTEQIKNNPDLAASVKDFLTTYQPNAEHFSPQINEEITSIL